MFRDWTGRRAALFVALLTIVVSPVAWAQFGQDCNGNGVPDAADIASASSADCNTNGVPDECDIDQADSPDCNANEVPDECDVAEETSPDCDSNGVPDECDVTLSAVLRDATGPIGELTAADAADLDGDGDLDLAYAFDVFPGGGERECGWVANVDGHGTFGPRRPIYDASQTVNDLRLVDLDGDTDRDLLVGLSSGTAKRVEWRENVDGLGSFGPPRLIAQAAFGAQRVFAADLDGDDDLDVIYLDDAPPWWSENLDGEGDFGEPRSIDPSLIHDVEPADVDGDGDIDLVMGGSNRVYWFENVDGAGSFTRHTIASMTADYFDVSARDIDGDGDVDVVAARSFAYLVVWFENTDGAGTFTNEVMLPDSRGHTIAVADIDRDGDLDVVSNEASGIHWHENLDGSGGFSARRRLGADVGVIRVAADLDGDLDPDLVVGGYSHHGLMWSQIEYGDCNKTGLPDACDVASGTSPDVNGNWIPDECELDCDLNGVLDEEETSCVSCNLDGDICPDELDCAQVDADTWSEPSVVGSLRLARTGADTQLQWDAPEAPGAMTVRYDVLRSPDGEDFVGQGLCLDFDITQRVSVDSESLGPGEQRFYLVRVENDCPGAGTLGNDSAGVPRVGVDCP